MQVENVKIMYDETSAELHFNIPKSEIGVAKTLVTKLKNKLNKSGNIELRIEEIRAKRSLNANNYLWALIDKLAKAVTNTPDGIYEIMLERYGVGTVVSVESSAKEQFMSLTPHSKLKGESLLNGKLFSHFLVRFGSSGYDSLQMSVLLNGVVEECKDLGIETIPEQELLSLINSWRK